jgi:hypothetical protein
MVPTGRFLSQPRRYFPRPHGKVAPWLEPNIHAGPAKMLLERLGGLPKALLHPKALPQGATVAPWHNPNKYGVSSQGATCFWLLRESSALGLQHPIPPTRHPKAPPAAARHTQWRPLPSPGPKNSLAPRLRALARDISRGAESLCRGLPSPAGKPAAAPSQPAGSQPQPAQQASQQQPAASSPQPSSSSARRQPVAVLQQPATAPGSPGSPAKGWGGLSGSETDRPCQRHGRSIFGRAAFVHTCRQRKQEPT